jgi:hypothetical protein
MDTCADTPSKIYVVYITFCALCSVTQQISDSMEPGFNPRVIAERSLRDDEDFPNLSWGHSSAAESNTLQYSDDDDEVPLSTLLMDQMSIEQEKESRSSSSAAQKSSDSPKKYSRNPNNILPQDDAEREERLEKQIKTNLWHNIVKGNLILKQGIVSKRKASQKTDIKF